MTNSSRLVGRSSRAVLGAAIVTVALGLGAVSAAADRHAGAANGRIAWTQFPDSIYTSQPDGTDQRLVVDLPSIGALVRDAGFSADASRLAVLYEQFGGGATTDTYCGPNVTCWSILIMNGDGSDVRVIYSSTKIAVGAIALSPDGRHVAFTQILDDPISEPLFVIDSDGRHLRQLTETNAYDTDSDPAWSPDGKTVAFDSNRVHSQSFSWSIYEVGFHNRHLNKVMPVGANDLEPAWSPDGSKLVFVRTFAYPDYRLFTVNSDGSGEHELLGLGASIERAVWSPDGQQLLYTLPGAIGIVNANGTGAHTVYTSTSVSGFQWLAAS